MPDTTYAATFCEPIACMQPNNGYVTLTDDRMSFIYIPNRDFTGPDSFSYTVMTQRGQVATAKCIFIDVNYPPPPPPTADTINHHINSMYNMVLA